LSISIGFYHKKVLVWLCLTIAIYFIISSLPSSIADQFVDIETIDQTIEIKENGQVVANDKKLNFAIKPLKKYDLFFVKILDEPETSYAFSQINIVFPKNIPLEKAKINPYLIHSYDPQTNYTIEGNVVTVTTGSIDPSGIYSIKVEIPKGYLKFGILTSFFGTLNNLSGTIWVLIAVLLPSVTLCYYYSLILYRKSFIKDIQNNQQLSLPPSSLAPALAGVLMKEKVDSRTIAGTIIDLAQRGLIDIYNKEADFSFIQKGQFTLDEADLIRNKNIRKFELFLLAKIFKQNQFKSTQEDISYRIGHRLFSDKIAKAYQEIYREIFSLGYYDGNPQEIHNRYKYYGLLTMFGGFLGVLVSAILTPDPKFLSLFWVAMMLIGELIIKYSSNMPILSETGKIEAKKWQAFKNYLSDSKPLKANDTKELEKYLSYAIVLGVEKEWIARYRESTYMTPVWFGSSKTNRLDIVSFSRELLPLVDWVSNTLDQAKTPV